MKFGESLQKERELRGITLEEISQQTKVHVRFLEAIEHDNLNVLPAKTFAKGFLRSYARMIGLDEDQVIANFEYCHQMLEQDEQTEPLKTHPSKGLLPRILLVILVVILLVTLGVLMFLYFHGTLPGNVFSVFTSGQE